MRAAIADMVPANRRGSAYGIFNAAYGLFWFLGSALMGFLYDTSLLALIGFSVGSSIGTSPRAGLPVWPSRPPRWPWSMP
jgi:MFS family permease